MRDTVKQKFNSYYYYNSNLVPRSIESRRLPCHTFSISRKWANLLSISDPAEMNFVCAWTAVLACWTLRGTLGDGAAKPGGGCIAQCCAGGALCSWGTIEFNRASNGAPLMALILYSLAKHSRDYSGITAIFQSFHLILRAYGQLARLWQSIL